MKHLLWAALLALAGCGAGDPPSAPGGMDLRAFWAEGS